MPALPLDEAGKYVAGAYVAFLALLLLYVAIMAARIQRIDRELAELAEIAEKRSDRPAQTLPEPTREQKKMPEAKPRARYSSGSGAAGRR